MATQLQEKHHRISLEVEVGHWDGIRTRVGFVLGGHPRSLKEPSLQFKHLSLSLPQYSELQDKVTSAETKVLEMETTVEDLQWDIEKLRKREQKLNKHLAEALEQVGLWGAGSYGARAGNVGP